MSTVEEVPVAMKRVPAKRLWGITGAAAGVVVLAVIAWMVLHWRKLTAPTNGIAAAGAIVTATIPQSKCLAARVSGGTKAGGIGTTINPRLCGAMEPTNGGSTIIVIATAFFQLSTVVLKPRGLSF